MLWAQLQPDLLEEEELELEPEALEEVPFIWPSRPAQGSSWPAAEVLLVADEPDEDELEEELEEDEEELEAAAAWEAAAAEELLEEAELAELAEAVF